MSANMPLERTIAAWMADAATTGLADGMVDDVLATTGRQRPLPRPLALLRERPMRRQSRVAVGSPVRRLGLVAALVVLLLAALAVAVGALINRAPALTSDDWPGFRGDIARAGVALTGPAGHPVLRWRFQATGSVSGALAIVGDTVYGDSDDGALLAIDRNSGTARWTFRAPGPLIGPAIANGLAYFVDGDGHMTAVDIATGTRRWQSPTIVLGPSKVGADGAHVYVGVGDGSLVAFDATTGAEVWRASVSTAGPASAAATDGTRVFAAATGDGLAAFDAATGKPVWRVATGTDPLGTPVVSGGIVYIGAAADTVGGRLRAIDAATGRVLWTVDEALQAPAVAGEVAYTASPTGRVVAFDVATGHQRWSFQVQGTTRAPAVAGGVVYVAADGEHRVYALDAATGGFLWRFDVDGQNECCIAVARGAVYVGTVLGSVYAIGGDGAHIEPAATSTAQSVASAPATASPTVAPSGSPRPAAATLLWTATAPDGPFVPNTMAHDPSGRIWVAQPDRDRFAIFKPDGTFVEFWGEPGSGPGQLDLRRHANGDGYGAIAFASDGSFYILDVGNERVEHFDAQRHFVGAWGAFGLNPGQFNDPVGIVVTRDGRIHVLDDVRGVIETYDSSGTVLGSFPAFVGASSGFNAANSLATDAVGNLYVSDIQPSQVERFDPAGNLTMTYGSPGTGPGQFSEQPGGMVVDSRGRLFINQGPTRDAAAPGVLVFDPDGTYVDGFGSVGPGDAELRWPTGMLLQGKDTLVVGDAASVADSSLTSALKAYRLLPPLKP